VFQDVLARRGEADDLSAAGDAITGAPKDASMPERVLRPFEECIACREDAQSIGALDRSLRRGFRAIAEGIPLPSEDAIARMLREVGDAPRAGILRRIRRTLNPTLWIVFWLLALLSACALFALAYRAIEG
jgi:hypothetical protein